MNVATRHSPSVELEPHRQPSLPLSSRRRHGAAAGALAAAGLLSLFALDRGPAPRREAVPVKEPASPAALAQEPSSKEETALVGFQPATLRPIEDGLETLRLREEPAAVPAAAPAACPPPAAEAALAGAPRGGREERLLEKPRLALRDNLVRLVDRSAKAGFSGLSVKRGSEFWRLGALAEPGPAQAPLPAVESAEPAPAPAPAASASPAAARAPRRLFRSRTAAANGRPVVAKARGPRAPRVESAGPAALQASQGAAILAGMGFGIQTGGAWTGEQNRLASAPAQRARSQPAQRPVPLSRPQPTPAAQAIAGGAGFALVTGGATAAAAPRPRGAGEPQPARPGLTPESMQRALERSSAIRVEGVGTSTDGGRQFAQQVAAFKGAEQGKEVTSVRVLKTASGPGSPGEMQLTFADGSTMNAKFDPIVLDLKGVGFTVGDAIVDFDVDGDGKPEPVSELPAGAGLLVFKGGLFGPTSDVDGDGKPDGHRDGFEALDALVRRAAVEGKLSAATLRSRSLDAAALAALERAYGLKVRVGSFRAEPIGLASAGVVELRLGAGRSRRVNAADRRGTDVTRRPGAAFTRSDGTVGEYADLWLSPRKLKDAFANALARFAGESREVQGSGTRKR